MWLGTSRTDVYCILNSCGLSVNGLHLLQKEICLMRCESHTYVKGIGMNIYSVVSNYNCLGKWH